ncbi:hypothetical protein PIB30_060711, partial [Stylosanthes scabra]|nr:hypothetical protein [Stylosanthes scabra]
MDRETARDIANMQGKIDRVEDPINDRVLKRNFFKARVAINITQLLQTAGEEDSTRVTRNPGRTSDTNHRSKRSFSNHGSIGRSEEEVTSKKKLFKNFVLEVGSGGIVSSKAQAIVEEEGNWELLHEVSTLRRELIGPVESQGKET